MHKQDRNMHTSTQSFQLKTVFAYDPKSDVATEKC